MNTYKDVCKIGKYKKDDVDSIIEERKIKWLVKKRSKTVFNKKGERTSMTLWNNTAQRIKSYLCSKLPYNFVVGKFIHILGYGNNIIFLELFKVRKKNQLECYNETKKIYKLWFSGDETYLQAQDNNISGKKINSVCLKRGG